MERPFAPNTDEIPTPPRKANPELAPKFLQPGQPGQPGQRLSFRCASTATNAIALSPTAFDGLAGLAG
jgi:hypothetical protein